MQPTRTRLFACSDDYYSQFRSAVNSPKITLWLLQYTAGKAAATAAARYFKVSSTNLFYFLPLNRISLVSLWSDN
jgi:hypothetical protein